MKAPAVLVLALLFVARSGWAQQLQAYDRLSKASVPMTAELGGSGASPGGSASLSTGQAEGTASTSRGYSSEKQVTVKAPMLKSIDGVTVEAYGVIKSYDTKDTRLQKLSVTKGDGPTWNFTISASKSVERVKNNITITDQTTGQVTHGVADTGRAVNHGDKIAGWFARIISNNQIIGVCGSSDQFVTLAGQPNPVAPK